MLHTNNKSLKSVRTCVYVSMCSGQICYEWHHKTLETDKSNYASFRTAVLTLEYQFKCTSEALMCTSKSREVLSVETMAR
jgi:hypothetical protein